VFRAVFVVDPTGAGGKVVVDATGNDAVVWGMAAAKVMVGHKNVVPQAIILAMAIIVDFLFTVWLPSDSMKTFIWPLH
jgi:ribulose 1,5-bisphosphate synthetase/thiazole synthase